jgi:hypothetical protein
LKQYPFEPGTETGALPSSHEGLNAEKWEVNFLENTVQKLTNFLLGGCSFVGGCFPTEKVLGLPVTQLCGNHYIA